MPKCVNRIGPDLSMTSAAPSADIRTAAQVTAGNQAFANGTVALGDDGRKYIYGKTAGAITTTSRVDYLTTTGLVTAAGSGGYISNNANTIESGGAAWFAAVQNYTQAGGTPNAAPPG